MRNSQWQISFFTLLSLLSQTTLASKYEITNKCGILNENIPPPPTIYLGIFGINTKKVPRYNQPWFTRLKITVLGNSYSTYCGGVFISTNNILTAASCLQVDSKSSKNKGRGIKLELDTYEGIERNVVESPEFKRYNFEYSVHPGFNGCDDNECKDNIAVITLQKDLDYVTPICIPDMTLPQPLTVDIIGYGGGYTSNDQAFPTFSEKLIQGRTSKISYQDCKEKFGYYLPEYSEIYDFEDAAYCYQGGSGMCYADSGGPVVSKMPGLASNSDNSGVIRFGLYGLMSFSHEECTKTTTKNYPSIFINIRNYLPWIQNTIKQDCYISTKSNSCENYKNVKPFQITDDVRKIEMELTVPDCHATNNTFLKDFEPFFENFEKNLEVQQIFRLDELMKCDKNSKNKNLQESTWRVDLKMYTAYNIETYLGGWVF